MSTLLVHSMFHDVLFPDLLKGDGDASPETLQLRRLVRANLGRQALLRDTPLVVFDFETTGLDYERDAIIEIGALKIVGGEVVDRFETFVTTDIELSEDIVRLTGITQAMLQGKPPIEEVLPQFLKFIDGGLLVAHNAEFDYTMLRMACSRLAIDIDWPCFCTMRMARQLLPELENKKLDTLAEHYGLTFEARHRSIGDVQVTSSVLKEMLSEHDHLATWLDVQPFAVNVVA